MPCHFPLPSPSIRDADQASSECRSSTTICNDSVTDIVDIARMSRFRGGEKVNTHDVSASGVGRESSNQARDEMSSQQSASICSEAFAQNVYVEMFAGNQWHRAGPFYTHQERFCLYVQQDWEYRLGLPTRLVREA